VMVGDGGHTATATKATTTAGGLSASEATKSRNNNNPNNAAYRCTSRTCTCYQHLLTDKGSNMNDTKRRKQAHASINTRSVNSWSGWRRLLLMPVICMLSLLMIPLDSGNGIGVNGVIITDSLNIQASQGEFSSSFTSQQLIIHLNMIL
jgi:hypothetical protein